jgi:predicted DNA-binding protein
MVKTLNITLDDEAYNRANKVKEASELTWAEFVEEAAEALDEQEGVR